MELSPDTVSLILNGYHNNLRMSQSYVSLPDIVKSRLIKSLFLIRSMLCFSLAPSFNQNLRFGPSPASLQQLTIKIYPTCLAVPCEILLRRPHWGFHRGR